MGSQRHPLTMHHIEQEIQVYLLTASLQKKEPVSIQFWTCCYCALEISGHKCFECFIDLSPRRKNGQNLNPAIFTVQRDSIPDTPPSSNAASFTTGSLPSGATAETQ